MKFTLNTAKRGLNMEMDFNELCNHDTELFDSLEPVHFSVLKILSDGGIIQKNNLYKILLELDSDVLYPLSQGDFWVNGRGIVISEEADDLIVQMGIDGLLSSIRNKCNIEDLGLKMLALKKRLDEYPIIRIRGGQDEHFGYGIELYVVEEDGIKLHRYIKDFEYFELTPNVWAADFTLKKIEAILLIDALVEFFPNWDKIGLLEKKSTIQLTRFYTEERLNQRKERYASMFPFSNLIGCSRCGSLIDDSYRYRVSIFNSTVPCCRNCADWLTREFDLEKYKNSKIE
ncbi:MAG: hypothetical protein Q4P17_04060 [Methanobacterium sp.]|nr:hypothetical protein [Methanobacterium sp.]